MEARSVGTIVLVAQNFNVPDARYGIARAAELRGLSIDKMEEKRRRFSTELTVTVSGDGEQIEDLRESLKGSGPLATPDDVAGELFAQGFDAIRTRFRKRFREGPPKLP